MSFNDKNHQQLELKQQNILILFLLQMRPKQWTKNLLLFAAPIFSIKKIGLDDLWMTIIGFFLFCIVAGCVYILNDFMDLEADRIHPEKRYRPMASGALNPIFAITAGGILLVGVLVAASTINPLFMGLLLFYFILNVLYSIRLKHVVIIDIMIIAAGFVLRAIAGGLVIHVNFTSWFLLCTMLLSLFLAITKRRQEFLLFEEQKGSHRKVLESYSTDLLNQLTSIVSTLTIISYSLFTFTSGHTTYLMWTIPLVIYGIFRYLYIIHVEGNGGAPEKVLLEDKHILSTVCLYAVTVIIIIVFFD
ncbi:decaprenyl-phosphate phosphoribosyltransferase [Falsibacillus pallidus]|uniref:decaprenyl-phosphate phosphoribosyltransferase n=1 Tax=Falsibacillus pallidus TaxID=493781 RepID=UPI003D9938B0